MPGRDEALSLETAIDTRTDSERASILARVQRRSCARARRVRLRAPCLSPAPLCARSPRVPPCAPPLHASFSLRPTPVVRHCSRVPARHHPSSLPWAPSTAATSSRSACSPSVSGSILNVLEHEIERTRARLRPNALATQLRSLLLHTPASSCAIPYVSASEDAFAELGTPSTRTRSRDPSRRAPRAATRTVAKLSPARAPAAARHVRRCGRKI
jgi:hypothetical protein